MDFPENDDDTWLTKSIRIDLQRAERNSTFGALFLLDSFSKAGDSIGASANLLKVSPYMFIFRNQTAATIDSYLLHHYKITQPAIKKYKADFAKICNQPRSEDWQTFKAMYEERRKIVRKLDECAEDDFVVYPVLRARLDSLGDVHDAYLHNYVLQNGWPTLANGALYAAAILKYHIGSSNAFYLYSVKNAIYNGSANYDLYNSIYWWYITERGLLAPTGRRTHANIFYALKRKRLYYSMGSMKNFNLSRSLDILEQEIQKHCPVYFCLEEESQDWKIAKEWDDKVVNNLDHRDCVSLLYKTLAEFNCNDYKEFIAGRTFTEDCMLNAGWATTGGWHEQDNQGLRLVMYVAYGDEIKDTSAFKMTFKDKKFITHAINFDNNKATIQQQSIGYMINMAEWLKDNKSINLEIDGHTDNTGNAAANQKLSEERAAAVKNMLVSMGVNEKRLTAKGLGSTVPLEPNTTETGKANNRRVEFIKM